MASSHQQIKPDSVNRIDLKHKAEEYKISYFYKQQKNDEAKFYLLKDGLISKAYFEVWRQNVLRILDVSNPIPNKVLEQFDIGKPKQSKECYKVTFKLKKGVLDFDLKIMDKYFLPRTPSPVDRKDEHENQGGSL